MVRHIVSWNYKDGFSKEENQEHAIKIKEALESLQNVIDGIISIKVIIDPLTSSCADIILNALYENEEALKGYQVHEAHQKVSAYVASLTQNRHCIDWTEE